jgi:excisionase family DNA binding protein
MAMSSSKPVEALPDAEEAALARASAEELSRLLAERPTADRAQVRMDGHDLILPRTAIALLRDLLTEFAKGNAVTVVPVQALLTTQQAADLLNVSRPHLIKLLEEERIPFSRVGTHRRIRSVDLLAYRQEQERIRQQALDELTRQAEENDMGY